MQFFKLPYPLCVLCVLCFLPSETLSALEPLLPGFVASAPFDEQAFVEQRSNQAFIPDDIAPRSLEASPRKPTAISGSAFLKSVVGVPIAERDRVQCIDSLGNRHSGVVFAMSDYLAVGTDEDWFRVPLSPNIAVQVADAFRATLLTTKLSDDVFTAATARLEPRPLTKDHESVETYFEHHRTIESQLSDIADKRLVAGIKKDIVFSNALKQKPNRVAIYGWHKSDGRPIQGLYVGHKDSYVDYSQEG